MKHTTTALACAALALALTPAADIAFGTFAAAALAKSENSGGGGNGNSGGNGNGGGNGGGQSDRSGGQSAKAAGAGNAPKKKVVQPVAEPVELAVAPGKGKVASELKGLNAAHASLTAMANASPNSRVGRIAAYREAYLEHQAALEDPEYLAARQGYLDALAALDDTATPEDLDTTLAALQALDEDGTFTEDEVLAALLDLDPEATDDDLATALEALDGAVEADNDLGASEAELADLLAVAAAPHPALEDGTAAWDRFHELLRLDQPLPDAGDETEAGAEDLLIEEIDEALDDETAAN